MPASAAAPHDDQRWRHVDATDTAEIGRTGVRVSRLGLGGVALSGAPPSTDPQRPTPEDEGVTLIRRSLALGLTYLDTAPIRVSSPAAVTAFAFQRDLV